MYSGFLVLIHAKLDWPGPRGACQRSCRPFHAAIIYRVLRGYRACHPAWLSSQRLQEAMRRLRFYCLRLGVDDPTLPFLRFHIASAHIHQRRIPGICVSTAICEGRLFAEPSDRYSYYSPLSRYDYVIVSLRTVSIPLEAE